MVKALNRVETVFIFLVVFCFGGIERFLIKGVKFELNSHQKGLECFNYLGFVS